MSFTPGLRGRRVNVVGLPLSVDYLAGHSEFLGLAVHLHFQAAAVADG